MHTQHQPAGQLSLTSCAYWMLSWQAKDSASLCSAAVSPVWMSTPLPLGACSILRDAASRGGQEQVVQWVVRAVLYRLVSPLCCRTCLTPCNHAEVAHGC